MQETIIEKGATDKVEKENSIPSCYHCGEQCEDEHFTFEEKSFCCLGCKTVFEILNENGLCSYYDLESNPGITLKNIVSDDKYAYLDNEKIIQQLSDFLSEDKQIITLYIPTIHCSSCIWLLENLYRLKPGIDQSRVDFSKKQVNLHFNPTEVSLREVVETLVSIGYEPQITLETHKKNKTEKSDKSLYLKIGVAGFCFGNIMLLAFPEYIGFDGLDGDLKQFFSYVSILFALPIVFYAASDYFKSAFKGFKQRYVNIDVPIAIGIVALFSRSIYEIITQTGNGYMDSLAGLLFFLLVGKWFQSKTYQGLSFERDYKSYFPLAINRLEEGGVVPRPVNEIEIGDKIQVKNNELIPVDGLLLSESASIDYSFVTGESMPVRKSENDYIYAGGKQVGGSIYVSVEKPVSQSYLTQLWNNDAFNKEEHDSDAFVNSISKYFTIAVLSIAVVSAIAWYFLDPSKMVNSFTAVLIVACPCALALSAPFTLGTTLRVFGNLGLYLKNTSVIEKMTSINHLVFDKTGTITYSDQSDIEFIGDLTEEETSLIYSLATQSSHPLSKMITSYFNDSESLKVDEFKEEVGKGISGMVSGKLIKIGSAKYANGQDQSEDVKTTSVYLAVEGICKGVFQIKNKYRNGIEKVMSELKKLFGLSLLSGDNNSEKKNLIRYFGEENAMRFDQLPEDKLQYVKSLQEHRNRVMMFGDGLNDAGALKQSDIGVVVADNVNNFTPASDIIMDAKLFEKLPQLLQFSRTAKSIVYASFALSFLYNIVGLSFAVSGNLTPIFAAILMPLSSITIVVFTTTLVNIKSKMLF